MSEFLIHKRSLLNQNPDYTIHKKVTHMPHATFLAIWGWSDTVFKTKSKGRAGFQSSPPVIFSLSLFLGFFSVGLIHKCYWNIEANVLACSSPYENVFLSLFPQHIVFSNTYRTKGKSSSYRHSWVCNLSYMSCK